MVDQSAFLPTAVASGLYFNRIEAPAQKCLPECSTQPKRGPGQIKTGHVSRRKN
ncbi:hypothetical protein Pan189_25470 [Stratiformator vulcanicus]|uniref:Uncharacterized protein n=1 Tax=Stratiformator vulcanicus TaxID=2527980 RepID=A0A517R2Q0_9PLAN|nr:hypothetical protein Pan189_25470 [Stratiformator vulcanicus]